MNEEPTKELPDRSSFEQRVFARFDLIDERLERLESRSYDTKPIWERALKHIMETQLEVGELKSKVESNDSKVEGIESRVERIETRVEGIGSRVERIETRVEGIGSIAERIETRVEGIGSRVERIETRVEGIGSIAEGIGKGVEGIGSIVKRVETKAEAIDRRMEALEGDVAGLRNDYGNLHNELIESQRDFKVKLMRRIDLVLEVMVDNHTGLRESDERLNRLESKLA